MYKMKNKICLIKAGSAVITRKDGTIDLNRIQDIGREISSLVQEGWKPILISSGASSSGKGSIDVNKLAPASQKSLTASIGQSALIAYYSNLLKIHAPNMLVGQILINRRNLAELNVYMSIKQTLMDMLDNNILPIINENDLLKELKLNFSDNDQLASIISTMLNIKSIILISDSDGVYSQNPKLYKDTKKIDQFDDDYKNWNIDIDDSNVSNGGMTSKLDVFKVASIVGINCFLIGKENLSKNFIKEYLQNKKSLIGTKLLASHNKNLTDYKNWLLTCAIPQGIVILSELGAKAISKKSTKDYRTNLYCIGIKEVYGEFKKGDIVSLRDNDFNLIGMGRTSFSKVDLAKGKCKAGKVFIHDNHIINLDNNFFVNRDNEYVSECLDQIKNQEAYRITQYKPLIKIDNLKKGNKKYSYDFVDEIEYCLEESSNMRYKAKTIAKQLNVSVQDWILFSVLRG